MMPLVEKLLVLESRPIRWAIKVIDETAQGFCFIVNDDGKMVGMLTDGDIRRALIASTTLDAPVTQIMKKNFTSLPADAPAETVQKNLTAKIRYIPLLNAEGRPVDYASTRRLKRIQVTEPVLNGNELAYVTDCIQTNQISAYGEYLPRFERAFAAAHGCEYAMTTSSGTAALHLALVAHGIGQNDEVILADFVDAPAANAILYAQATPVPVDINAQTWTLDPAAVEAAITPRTRAILASHLYGIPCAMDALAEIARRHKVLLIEDCAHALGSEFKDRKVGSLGDAAVFSFQGNKTLTTGEGGMILFKDAGAHERALMLRDQGRDRKTSNLYRAVGFNYRMTNLQAAIGLAQLERLPEIIAAKQTVAHIYDEALKGMDGVLLPPRPSWAKISFGLYTVLLDEKSRVTRDEMMERLRLSGIESYATFIPLHEMDPYRKFGQGRRFPHSEKVSKMGISLPSSPSLDKEELKSICTSLVSIFSMREHLG